MAPDLTRLRHAQLFEILRQQSISERASARLRARGFAREQIDHDDAAMIRAMAVQSWGASTPTISRK